MSFVDSEFGSDANAGTLEKPFASIAHAVAVHQQCELIYVFCNPLKKSEYVTGRKTFKIQKVINTV